MVYTVSLGDAHQAYQKVYLRRELPDDANFCVVWVRVPLLMECFARDEGYCIPPVEKWKQAKVDGIRDLLNPEKGTRAPYMPRVGARRKESVELSGSEVGSSSFLQYLLGCLFRRKPVSTETEIEAKHVVVSFVNGRHRARYMQWAGATKIPVEVHRWQAQLLRDACG